MPIRNRNNVFNHPQHGFESTLIDTVKFRLQLPHPSLADLASRNPQVRWHGHRLTVQSSFDGVNASLWSSADNQTLLIEASVPRFLTGQSIFGITRLRQGVEELAHAVLERAGIEPTDAVRRALSRGAVDLLRVDIAGHVKCLDKDVAGVMRALRGWAVVKDHDWSAIQDEVVTLGERSRRRTFKIYRENVELTRRSLGLEVWHREHVESASRRLIRFELSLRRKALLDRKWDMVKDCSGGVLFEQLNEWYVRVTQPLQRIAVGVVEDERVKSLPVPVRLRFRLWKAGDTKAFDVTPATKREHRRLILDATGFDIESPVPPVQQREALRRLEDALPPRLERVSRSSLWERMKGGPGA